MAQANSSTNVGGASNFRTGTSVVIIADSRGRGLQTVFSQIKDRGYAVTVLFWKGRGMTEAVKDSIKQLVWTAPDIIVVLAGICDLTVRDRESRQVSLSFDTMDLAVDMFVGRMDTIHHFLTINLTERAFKLIFSQVVGMDMGTYNGLPYPHPQQDLLDSVIHRLNNEIVSWNMVRNVATPWIASDIHHNRKDGQKIVRYQRLASDGLHLTDELKQRWVTYLHKAILKTIT